MTALTSNVILNKSEDISKAIKSIKTRGVKWERDVWVAAISAMKNHADHGQPALVNQLMDAMPKSTRKTALQAFIETCGKCTFDETTKLFVHDKEGVYDQELALEKSWVEYKPQPKAKVVDFDADFAKALKVSVVAITGDTPHNVNVVHLYNSVQFARGMDIELSKEVNEWIEGIDALNTSEETTVTALAA